MYCTLFLFHLGTMNSVIKTPDPTEDTGTGMWYRYLVRVVVQAYSTDQMQGITHVRFDCVRLQR